MKLTLRSWGGFAGPAGAITRSVDLDTLADDRRRAALALVAAAHPFDRPPKIQLAKPHPWDFTYLLEIQDDARSTRIQMHLEAVDESLRTLVLWIEKQCAPAGATPAQGTATPPDDGPGSKVR
jgi:hypothetical protein